MHDIWNPWQGCVKFSEGCQNCYMYFLDSLHNGNENSTVTKTSAFNHPLSKLRDGRYKITAAPIAENAQNNIKCKNTKLYFRAENTVLCFYI